MKTRRTRKQDVQLLETLLEALDMTNTDLAQHAGVARSSVQRWLAGTVQVPLSVLRMLELMQHARQTPGMARVLWANPDEMLLDDLRSIPPRVDLKVPS